MNSLFDRQFPGLGSITSVRGEVDAAFVAMRGFHQMEPEDVMRLIGGLSARLVELRVVICRFEDLHPQWRPIRTQEIEPVIEELGRQYAIASRLHSVKDFEWRTMMGAP